MTMPQLPPYASQHGDDLVIRLKVVPQARRNHIIGPLGDRLKIAVTAPPVDGLANKAVISILKEYLQTDAIELIAGHHQATKTVRVRALSKLPAWK